MGVGTRWVFCFVLFGYDRCGAMKKGSEERTTGRSAVISRTSSSVLPKAVIVVVSLMPNGDSIINPNDSGISCTNPVITEMILAREEERNQATLTRLFFAWARQPHASPQRPDENENENE